MSGTIWIVAFGVLSFALSSCAPTPLPLHTTVDALKIRKTPLTAALVLPDALKHATSKQEVSCAGTFDVPIGAELETGMMQADPGVVRAFMLLNPAMCPRVRHGVTRYYSPYAPS